MQCILDVCAPDACRGFCLALPSWLRDLFVPQQPNHRQHRLPASRMPSRSLIDSTLPFFLYPRLRTLSHRQEPSGTISRYLLLRSTTKWIRLDDYTHPLPATLPATHSKPSQPLCCTSNRADARTISPDSPRSLLTMKDPVARTSSPYIDPLVKGPKSQILTSGTQADLRKSPYFFLHSPFLLLVSISLSYKLLTFLLYSARQYR